MTYNQDKQDCREMSEDEMDLEKEAETMCCFYGKTKEREWRKCLIFSANI